MGVKTCKCIDLVAIQVTTLPIIQFWAKREMEKEHLCLEDLAETHQIATRILKLRTFFSLNLIIPFHDL